jgi:hypothetical protein
LYRVTCGDIGTKPEEVEKVSYPALSRGTEPKLVYVKYLEAVLLLGKIWGCGKSHSAFDTPKSSGRRALPAKADPVVLLDEADVFLEERGLTDLKRNALVSGKGDLRQPRFLYKLTSDGMQVFLRVLEYYDGKVSSHSFPMRGRLTKPTIQESSSSPRTA